ncbi:type II secretion system F family protein [Granulicoccus phenolivorans]|uniref:type II secretion system F family protein n=1 Tax=Granulicoccus phenolivorans TaxID=266854 RepID=UPI0004159698|nr:type II secretion system F family protein [Granulicoccus phenolivorans]
MRDLLVVAAIWSAALGVWALVPPDRPVRLLPGGGVPPWWRAWTERERALAVPVRGGVAAAVVVAVLLLGQGVLPGGWSVVLALLAGAAGFVGLGLIQPDRIRRRRETLVLELPEALGLLAATLQAGLPLRIGTARVAEALSAAGATGEAGAEPSPVAEDLGLVLTGIEVGMNDREAWRLLAEEEAWRAVARDLARSADAGSALAEILQTHRVESAHTRRAHRERAAKTVGVRSVAPLMICFLPAFMILGVVPVVGSLILAML